MVICAIRGGASSQPTIRRAILTAKKHSLPLRFLYVLNLDFLMRATQSRTQTITEEMQELGEFILLAAQAQAERQGVVAEGVIREADGVEEAIVALCQEVNARYVVLGRPRAAAAENVFTREQLDEFGRHIERETGAEVIYPAENEQ